MKSHAIMYHDVIPFGRPDVSGFQSPDADIYKLDKEHFQDHLSAIKASGRSQYVTSIDRFLKWGEVNPVFLTFDDGGVSFFDTIAEMLEENGWHGHFFITTGRIGTPGFLSAYQIAELRRRGHVIGTHSVTHPHRMSALSRTDLMHEWGYSRNTLEDIIGESVRVASVPGGMYSRAVGEAAAESGILFLFNSEPTTAVDEIAGCRVLGRFNVQRDMRAAASAQFATGLGFMPFRQSVFWKMKKVLKSNGGESYLRLRSFVIRNKMHAGK